MSWFLMFLFAFFYQFVCRERLGRFWLIWKKNSPPLISKGRDRMSQVRNFQFWTRWNWNLCVSNWIKFWGVDHPSKIFEILIRERFINDPTSWAVIVSFGIPIMSSHFGYSVSNDQNLWLYWLVVRSKRRKPTVRADAA